MSDMRPNHYLPPARQQYQSALNEHRVNQMIHTSLLEFERAFGKQMRDDQSRAMQEISTSVTNALSPVLAASSANAKSIGSFDTEIKVLKTRIVVLSTIGVPVGAFLGFIAGKLI